MQLSSKILCVAFVAVALFAVARAFVPVAGICAQVNADAYCQGMVPQFVCAQNTANTTIDIKQGGTLAHYNEVRNLTFGLCANKVFQCAYSINATLPMLKIAGHGCNQTVPASSCQNHLCQNAAVLTPTRFCHSLLTGQALGVADIQVPSNALPYYQPCNGLGDTTTCAQLPSQPCQSECSWCYESGYCSQNSGDGKIYAAGQTQCYVPVLNAGSVVGAGVVALLSVVFMLL
eukprot:gnl/Hemi2/2624_TR936_c0_g1_i1.p2 gnl/Hemi2/2624_TR936_c0_g1~~gnl/Hemi2/2624_TR936_c0_g1_i1.p2  ORF type:complete len:232 (-),score=73.17 gnl/Hemi2/2624_TR936_c0_g1_i1:151-846(-)